MTSIPVVLSDASGTVTTGGTAQTACSANPNRSILIIANPDPTNDLYYSLTTTATLGGAGSVRLPAGTGVIFDTIVPTGAVSIYGATSAKAFTVQQA